jgi:Immunity protein Imm1
MLGDGIRSVSVKWTQARKVVGPRRHHLCMEEDSRLLVTQMGAPRFPRGPDDTVESPSNHDVEQAIRRLNGTDFHDVYLLTSDPAAFLAICGGPDRYAVMLTDHEQLGLADNTDEPSEATAEIMCGGQPADFTRINLVDFQTALTAAVHYLDTATADPTLSWEWYPL